MCRAMPLRGARLKRQRYTDEETKTSDHLLLGVVARFRVHRGGWLLRAVRIPALGTPASVPISDAAAAQRTRASGGCGHRGHSQHGGVRFEAGGALGQRRAAGGGAAIGSPSRVRSLGPFGQRARFDRRGEGHRLGVPTACRHRTAWRVIRHTVALAGRLTGAWLVRGAV